MNLFSPENRRRLTLKPGKERVVANRHPWIFAGAIAAESGYEDAAIADLVDPGGAIVASGLYSRSSQIRLRALTFGGEELSASTIEERIAAAIRRRDPILRDGTNAARLVHSEGDDLSGLVIDRYADMVVVEIANSGLEKIKDLIAATVERVLQPRLVYYKNDLPARGLERLSPEPRAVGEGEAIAEIAENGLRFMVDAREGQKTGFFLDQRENRALTRSLASGKSVINLFAYTGAFGVHAAAGGAKHVENVDVSASAIEHARRNHELNGSAATFTVADAFAFVRERTAAKQTADFLICDPPAFAKSRAEIDRAARGYKDINLYALRMVNPGGLLMTFSCSGHMSIDLFQKVIFSAAADAGRRVAFVRRLTAGPDHPVSLYAPEGEYLKGFLLEVR
ncbi:MAG TPA: class I SAM-dependent rRNA methyltransferase [Thermoanaerobaculia bacterium]|nr:class I SAM-dependent rRNA methyltransferase [Thermoanaerobaculia bacterium]